MKRLSSNDVERLREQLIQMRTRLLDEIQTAKAEIQAVHEALEGGGVVGSDASELTRIEELRRSEIEIDERQLGAVEEAEHRMNEGHYGVCKNCGRVIPTDRLFALPTAVRCTECERNSSSEPV